MAEAPTRVSSGITLRPGRVLIVDDDRHVGDALTLLLSDENHVVLEHRAALALARLLRGERYDVVLCDLMMPEMSGIELYDRLADALPEEAGRIVFMTGGRYVPLVQAFLERVPNMCLEKPFHVPSLRALIERRMRASIEPRRSGGT